MHDSPWVWLIMAALLGTHMAGMGASVIRWNGATLREMSQVTPAGRAGAAVLARLHFAVPGP